MTEDLEAPQPAQSKQIAPLLEPLPPKELNPDHWGAKEIKEYSAYVGKIGDIRVLTWTKAGLFTLAAVFAYLIFLDATGKASDVSGAVYWLCGLCICGLIGADVAKAYINKISKP